MIEYLWVIGTASSVAVIVSGGIVYLMRIYLTEHIKASVRNEYDTKLESLKGEIVRSNKVFDTILTSQNQIFHAGHNERLNAVKVLWSNFMVIRENLHSINTIDEILLEKEFNTIYTDKWVGNSYVPDVLNKIPNDILKQLQLAIDSVEEVRPFLNESIWISIVSLKLFTGRILYLYREGSKIHSLKHWKSDTALMNLIKETLTSSEYEFIVQTQIGSIRISQNFIEQKILMEINKVISGQIAADNTHAQAIRLGKLEKENLSD